MTEINQSNISTHINESFLLRKPPQDLIKFNFWGKLNYYFTKLHISCYNNTYKSHYLIMTPEAERFNGWAAMLGFVAAVGAYVTTGQIIPGWF